MAKLKLYADLFGPCTLSRILEYEGEVKHEKLDKALQQIDDWSESGFDMNIDKDILDWINSKILDEMYTKQNKFEWACIYGHIKIAKWLYELDIIDIHGTKNNMFLRACSYGHLDIARWLYRFGVDINYKDNHAFQEACENGHLDIAKWLIEKGIVEYVYTFDYNRPFRLACANGHLEVAKWLVSLDDTIHADVDSAFRSACAHGHLEVAQWLYGLGGIDIHYESDWVFRLADKHKHILEWLISLEA